LRDFLKFNEVEVEVLAFEASNTDFFALRSAEVAVGAFIVKMTCA
jgi:hypothetical protein